MSYTFDSRVVSDLHKDAFGCRPAHDFWAEWALAENDGKQRIWDNLVAAMDASMSEEEAREKAAIEDFENKILWLLLAGSKDRKTAIRKVIQSLNLTSVELLYGGEYACFQLGLPFAVYSKELDEVVAKMQQN
jgi:predicted Fe-S protein YdhL (DUF1289 family)